MGMVLSLSGGVGLQASASTEALRAGGDEQEAIAQIYMGLTRLEQSAKKWTIPRLWPVVGSFNSLISAFYHYKNLQDLQQSIQLLADHPQGAVSSLRVELKTLMQELESKKWRGAWLPLALLPVAALAGTLCGTMVAMPVTFCIHALSSSCFNVKEAHKKGKSASRKTDWESIGIGCGAAAGLGPTLVTTFYILYKVSTYITTDILKDAQQLRAALDAWRLAHR